MSDTRRKRRQLAERIFKEIPPGFDLTDDEIVAMVTMFIDSKKSHQQTQKQQNGGHSMQSPDAPPIDYARQPDPELMNMQAENQRLKSENRKLSDNLKATVGGLGGYISGQRDRYAAEVDEMFNLLQSFAARANSRTIKAYDSYIEQVAAIKSSMDAGELPLPIKLILNAIGKRINDYKAYGEKEIAPYYVKAGEGGVLRGLEIDKALDASLEQIPMTGVFELGQLLIQLTRYAFDDPRLVCAEIKFQAEENAGVVPLKLVLKLSKEWIKTHLDSRRAPSHQAIVDHVRIGYRLINNLPLSDEDNYKDDSTKRECKRQFNTIQDYGILRV